MDKEIGRVFDHLKLTLKVAGVRCGDSPLRQVAEQGWIKRQKGEKQQTGLSRACWAAEMFAASEFLLNQSKAEFQGIAAFLSLCATDALDSKSPDGATTKAALTDALIRIGNKRDSAKKQAHQLWMFRCSGVHLGLTDQLDIRYTVMVGENLVTGDTLDEVMKQHRAQRSQDPATLVDQSVFSRNMYLFPVARLASAAAIAHRNIDLTAQFASL